MMLSIGEASNFIGVSISTLRRWDKSGKLKPTNRTLGGHRRYKTSDIQTITDSNNENDCRRLVAYARVSSHDQKNDLKRQSQRLEKYCKSASSKYEVIEDLGSGLNFKKRGLKKLIKLIIKGQVKTLILTHKDRLLRFGSEIIFILCDYFGTKIQVIEEEKLKSDEEVLAKDVLEIITVFSARMYGIRSHQNKRKLAQS